eukprot:scaffold7862_cov126-Isochrysis_galbana.AAC.2
MHIIIARASNRRRTACANLHRDKEITSNNRARVHFGSLTGFSREPGQLRALHGVAWPLASNVLAGRHHKNATATPLRWARRQQGCSQSPAGCASDRTVAAPADAAESTLTEHA